MHCKVFPLTGSLRKETSHSIFWKGGQNSLQENSTAQNYQALELPQDSKSTPPGSFQLSQGVLTETVTRRRHLPWTVLQNSPTYLGGTQQQHYTPQGSALSRKLIRMEGGGITDTALNHFLLSKTNFTQPLEINTYIIGIS